jgi:lysophospholipase L1-like esterase
MNGQRSFFKGLLAAGLSVALALGLAELFLRVVYDPLEPRDEQANAPPNWEASAQLYQDDPLTGYRMRPDTQLAFVRQSDGAAIPVRTNNLGFRDDEDYQPGSEDSTLRVLLLGDSLVFGAGVLFEETIGERLEGILAEDTGQAVQVMNWGVPGYGQEQERLLLESLGADDYQPDLILVLVTTSNDFGQTLDLSTLEEVAGGVQESVAAPSTSEESAPESVSLAERIKRPLRGLRTYRLVAVYGNRLLGALGRREVEFSDEAAQASRADLEKLLAYGDSTGLRVAFALIPPRVFATPLEEQYAYERRVYMFYADTLDDLGADWLDLESALIDGAAMADPARIYWDDVHLTAEGDQIAAQAVAEAIGDFIAAGP